MTLTATYDSVILTKATIEDSKKAKVKCFYIRGLEIRVCSFTLILKTWELPSVGPSMNSISSRHFLVYTPPAFFSSAVPASCYINSIDMWLDILLPSNSEDIDSEKKAQGSQRIQVKGHSKLQDTI